MENTLGSALGQTQHSGVAEETVRGGEMDVKSIARQRKRKYTVGSVKGSGACIAEGLEIFWHHLFFF